MIPRKQHDHVISRSLPTGVADRCAEAEAGEEIEKTPAGISAPPPARDLGLGSKDPDEHAGGAGGR